MILCDGLVDIRCGDWREVLADVEACDAVITDPPYSAKAHLGFRSHDDLVAKRKADTARREEAGTKRYHGSISYGSMGYDPIDEHDTVDLASWTEARSDGWFVAFGDHVTWSMWQRAMDGAGWYVFAPPCVVADGWNAAIPRRRAMLRRRVDLCLTTEDAGEDR